MLPAALHLADHAPGGFHHQDADGQGPSHAQGVQALFDEQGGVALDAVFHGVVNARAGHHGNDADEKVGGDGALLQPGQDLGIKGHNRRADKAGEQVRGEQKGQQIGQPAQGPAHSGPKNGPSMEIIKAAEAETGYESIENREAFEGIISIGEQPLGFGEETGIVDLHTGDNVDGLDADGAIENLINDVAHETDQFLNDVDRSNVPEIETGSDIDPVSAEEIGGQGLGKGNDLASEDMNIDGFIPESMENPIAQTAVEDISGSAEIEEALALLL